MRKNDTEKVTMELENYDLPNTKYMTRGGIRRIQFNCFLKETHFEIINNLFITITKVCGDVSYIYT